MLLPHLRKEPKSLCIPFLGHGFQLASKIEVKLAKINLVTGKKLVVSTELATTSKAYPNISGKYFASPKTTFANRKQKTTN
jgi:hypothetical protein